jgi:hypothetical protein
MVSRAETEEHPNRILESLITSLIATLQYYEKRMLTIIRTVTFIQAEHATVTSEGLIKV